MTDEELWKRRFLLFMLVRLSGVFIIAFGMAVAFTDVVSEGGWRIGGAALIALGTIEAALGPLMLRKAWSKEQ
jgi:hypothetical protein